MPGTVDDFFKNFSGPGTMDDQQATQYANQYRAMGHPILMGALGVVVAKMLRRAA